MRWYLLSFCLLALGMSACSDEPAPAPTKEFTPAELDERLDRNTPEGTLRVLVIGMQVDDAPLIESLAGPLTQGDLALLMSNQRPTLSKEIQLQQGAALQIRHLQPGDVVPLEDGSEITVPPHELETKNQWLMIQTIPMPLRLHKIEDRWQVDVEPLIAARRAAKLRAGK